jgi:carboxymethylenebutenolidase
MKYFTLCIILMLTISRTSLAQQSCCTVSATAKFASFAAEDEFIRAHSEPAPYKAEALAGTMITFPATSGANGSAYLATSKKHPNKVILMFHDFWGLNDYNKSEADLISKELDVTVCAIDLFEGKVPTNRDEASKAAQGIVDTRANAIIDGAIIYFGKTIRFGTIGWCMGGSWSQQAALRAGTQADACVIYYGMPETNLDKLKELHAPVLGIFGKKDKWITPQVVSDYEAAMKKAGKRLSIHSYDADHAFANPSDPHHDKVSKRMDFHSIKYNFRNLAIMQGFLAIKTMQSISSRAKTKKIFCRSIFFIR